MLWKQNEHSIISSALNEQKQVEKSMLSTIYKQQMQENDIWWKQQQELNLELERRILENAKGYDPSMNEKLKWEAYKAELEKELEQRNKMKELETLLAEQSKYELNK